MINYNPIIQKIALLNESFVDVLRLDLIHPLISGNKWFKLTKNIACMRQFACEGLITFGGAHSNHIAATAAAGAAMNFKTVGIIRGESTEPLSPTLVQAQMDGMELVFVSRTFYKDNKFLSGEANFLDFKNYWLVPEGGANKEGIEGAGDILKNVPFYDYVLCACGTGTTFAGLLQAANPDTKVIGISVLKGKNSIVSDLGENLPGSFSKKISEKKLVQNQVIDESTVTNDYAGKGYARMEPELVEFKRTFELKHQIPLDHVYTTKLFNAATDLLSKGCFLKDARILLIHSGGLQGNAAFEKRFGLFID